MSKPIEMTREAMVSAINQAWRDGHEDELEAQGTEYAEAFVDSMEIFAEKGTAIDLDRLREQREDPPHYSEPFRDTYDEVEVRVHPSSAAMIDACWLSLNGEGHVKEGEEIREYSPAFMLGGERMPPTLLINARLAAHLSVEQAQRVRDNLSSWLKAVGAEPNE